MWQFSYIREGVINFDWELIGLSEFPAGDRDQLRFRVSYAVDRAPFLGFWERARLPFPGFWGQAATARKSTNGRSPSRGSCGRVDTRGEWGNRLIWLSLQIIYNLVPKLFQRVEQFSQEMVQHTDISPKPDQHLLVQYSADKSKLGCEITQPISTF